jgi:hypothetical protein
MNTPLKDDLREFAKAFLLGLVWWAAICGAIVCSEGPL